VSEDVLLTDSPIVPASLPDRADAPVSEITERFLRAVIAEVPVERIEELHLFSPLRQGTLETGIAVIALRAVAPIAQADGNDNGVEAPELPFEDTEVGDVIEDVLTEFVADEIIVVDAIVEDVTEDVVAEEIVIEVIEDESPYADDVIEDVVAVDEVHLADATGTPEDEPVAVAIVAAAPRPPRHTVFTARYRYIIKGPERGKWESSVKAEAEAPLITVETVVRGVQRRAGEESEIVRYSGEQIARALRIPFPTA
jgi:hypothetical protein